MSLEKPANGGGFNRYAELRTLLIGPERDELDQLRARLDTPQLRAADVSEVLPAALRLGTSRDGTIPPALHPLVEEAVRISIRRNPGILAEALVPIIGLAMRRASAAWFRRAMAAINRTIEQTLTPSSISWRWQAFRQRTPFSDLALRRSRLFRVEQVFLIQNGSGRILQKRLAEGAQVRDPEGVLAIPGMLQEFVRNLGEAQPERGSEILHFGSSEIWMEYSHQVLLAAAISGAPPVSLKPVLADALQDISRRKHYDLTRFGGGDTNVFDSCQEQLKACLVGGGSDRPPRFIQVWLLAGLLALVAFSFGIYFGRTKVNAWQAYVDRLRGIPGIVVISSGQQGDRYSIYGLRDPLAPDPVTLLRGTGLNQADVQSRWDFFHSLDQAFEKPRQLTIERDLLERQSIHFAERSFQVPADEYSEVDLVARHLLVLNSIAKELRANITVELVGHADDAGSPEANNRLATARVEAVRAALVAAGIRADLLSVPEKTEPSVGRAVTLLVKGEPGLPQ